MPEPFPDEIKPLNENVARMLRDVVPTVKEQGPPSYPCEAVSDDGTIWPRVYLVEMTECTREYVRSLKRNPLWLPAERIVSLRSSPHRLDPKFVAELEAAGESGMGYSAFSLKLRDGRRLYYVTGNNYDFPNWPEDVRPEVVVAVKPHDRHPEHRNRAPTIHESGAQFALSPFRGG